MEGRQSMSRDQLLTIGDLEDFKQQLLSEIKLLVPHRHNTGFEKQWLRSAEVRKMLGVSAGTLQNLRVNGTLPFTKVGGIVFYKLDDILKALEEGKD